MKDKGGEMDYWQVDGEVQINADAVGRQEGMTRKGSGSGEDDKK